MQPDDARAVHALYDAHGVSGSALWDGVDVARASFAPGCIGLYVGLELGDSRSLSPLKISSKGLGCNESPSLLKRSCCACQSLSLVCIGGGCTEEWSSSKLNWNLALAGFQRQELPCRRAGPLVSESRNGSPAPVAGEVWVLCLAPSCSYPTTSLSQKSRHRETQRNDPALKKPSPPQFLPPPATSFLTINIAKSCVRAF